MSKYTYCNCLQGKESKQVKPYRLVHAKDGQCTECDHYVVTTVTPIDSRCLIDYLKSSIIEKNQYIGKVTNSTGRKFYKQTRSK